MPADDVGIIRRSHVKSLLMQWERRTSTVKEEEQAARKPKKLAIPTAFAPKRTVTSGWSRAASRAGSKRTSVIKPMSRNASRKASSTTDLNAFQEAKMVGTGSMTLPTEAKKHEQRESVRTETIGADEWDKIEGSDRRRRATLTHVLENVKDDDDSGALQNIDEREEEVEARREREAKAVAAAEAREKAEKEAKAAERKKAAEERARIKAEEEAKAKAEEEAKAKAEEEARLKAEEEARLKAEEEAKAKAEEEARLKAEEEARLKAEEEARLKAEEEAKAKAEEEARLKAEEEAKAKAEEEAKAKAEEETRLKAEAEEEASMNSEEENIKSEDEEKIKAAEEEAKLKAEQEAKAKAEEEEARLKAEEEAKAEAEEEARLKAEQEANAKAEEEAKAKAEEEARLKAEEEAKAKAEEEARLKAEEEARLKAEEEARLKAEEEAKAKAEEEARLKAEEEAKTKAEEAKLKEEASAKASQLQTYALALYDYNSPDQHQDDLTFAAGDLILLAKWTRSDWWAGSIGGKTGIFPAAYVELLESTDPRSPAYVTPPQPAQSEAEAAAAAGGGKGGNEMGIGEQGGDDNEESMQLKSLLQSAIEDDGEPGDFPDLDSGAFPKRERRRTRVDRQISAIAEEEKPIEPEAVHPDAYILRVVFQRESGELASTVFNFPSSETVAALTDKVRFKMSLQKASPPSSPQKVHRSSTGSYPPQDGGSSMGAAQGGGGAPDGGPAFQLYHRHSATAGVWLDGSALLSQCGLGKDYSQEEQQQAGHKHRRSGSNAHPAQVQAGGVVAAELAGGAVKSSSLVVQTLIYMRRKTRVKVRLHGGGYNRSAKPNLFVFDTSQTAGECVQEIGLALGLHKTSCRLFALQLLYPRRRWLEPEVALYDSTSLDEEYMELAFRKRFLLEHIQQLPKRDPSAFQMIYSQAVHMVTSGRLACSFQLAALFGALLINNTSGSYERYVERALSSKSNAQAMLEKLYRKSLPEVLPRKYWTNAKMVTSVREAHSALGKMDKQQGMVAYLNLIGSQYGAEGADLQTVAAEASGEGGEAGGEGGEWEEEPDAGYGEYVGVGQTSPSKSTNSAAGGNGGGGAGVYASGDDSEDLESADDRDLASDSDGTMEFSVSTAPIELRSDRRRKTTMSPEHQRLVEEAENFKDDLDSEGQSDSTGESAARTWMVQRFAVLTKSIFGSMQTRLAEINLGHDIIEIFKITKKAKELVHKIFAIELVRLEKDLHDLTQLRLTSVNEGTQALFFRTPNERQKFYSGICRLVCNVADWANSSEANMQELRSTTTLGKISPGSLALSWAHARRMQNATSNNKLHKDAGFQRSTLQFGPGELALKVFAGTHNMGKNPPAEATLCNWVPLGMDVYAIAVQECKYKPRKSFADAEADWVDLVKSRVEIFGNYHVVDQRSMWEIKIVILIRQELLPFVTNIEVAHVATGLANVGKNKGGVGVSFNIFETSFCFINAHLNARPSHKRMLVRNRNAEDILRHISLGDRGMDPYAKFDFLMVLGDLNYRVTGKARNEIIDLINQKNWKELLKMDQLLKEQAKGRVLFDMQEGEIDWKPSYRYQEFKDDWSLKKLQNLPSYTDRILWRHRPGLQCEQVAYDQFTDFMGSDHRPVAATLLLGLWEPIPAPISEVKQFFPPVRVRVYGLVVDLFCPIREVVVKDKGEGLKDKEKKKQEKKRLKEEKKKEKDLKNAKTELKKVTINNTYLKEALEIHGDFFAKNPDPTTDGKRGASKDKQKDWERWDEVMDKEEPVMPLPKMYRSTGRFVADEVITCNLGNMYTTGVQREALTLSILLKEGSSSVATSGHALIGLMGATGVRGRVTPEECSGYITLHGQPLGAFKCWVCGMW